MLSNTFKIGGELEVSRLGYGAMRLTGQPNNFGPYPDWEGGKTLLQRAADLGVNFFDTALPYGPGHNERLLAEGLAGRSVVIATKGGVDKPEPGNIVVDARPATLRAHVERSLASLGSECIDLYQLHRIDPRVALEDSVGELGRLREEGKLRFVGLSNVTLEQYELAKSIAPIASVQNRFNVLERGAEAVVRATARDGAAFIPYGPLGAKPMEHGAPLAAGASPLISIATALGATAGQVAIAWLLHVAPNVVVIPCTTQLDHLAENIAAGKIELADSQIEALNSLAAES